MTFLSRIEVKIKILYLLAFYTDQVPRDTGNL